MAGILLAIGKNTSGRYKNLHDDFLRIKYLNDSNSTIKDYYSISKFARFNELDENILLSDDISLFCVGTIFYSSLTGRKVLEHVKKQLINVKIQDVVQYLDGHYILIIIDKKKNLLQIVTDHAGMIHLYSFRDDDNYYFSTSSRIFSKNFGVNLNIEASAQFLRCDSICDCDTIYNEIKVLEAAAIYTFKIDNPGNNWKELYWKSPTTIEEDMTLEEATNLWADTLLNIGKMISSGKIICDLTGGYDTRSILSGILPYIKNRNNDFSTFVFGPNSSNEVKVAKEICSQLKLKIMHTTLPDNWKNSLSDYLNTALKYSDGEENLIGFASMLYANQVKRRNFSTSVNGMSGGCVRPFFWIQEVTYEKRPANIDRFLNMRAFQYEYDNSVFAGEWRNQIDSIPNLLSRKYLNSISDMDFHNTYNTLQLDNIDLRQRERRWGGRTISSSNQIIRIISPLYFRKCMDIGFTIPPKYKIRDLLNRRVITKLNPKLARQRMITGVPCEEISVNNFYRFYPIIPVYIKKLTKVLSQQIFRRTVLIDKSLSYPKYEMYELLLSNKEQNEMGNVESWITRKIYDPKRVNEFIARAKKPGFRFYGQLEKMISFEIRLREDKIDSGAFS